MKIINIFLEQLLACMEKGNELGIAKVATLVVCAIVFELKDFPKTCADVVWGLTKLDHRVHDYFSNIIDKKLDNLDKELNSVLSRPAPCVMLNSRVDQPAHDSTPIPAFQIVSEQNAAKSIFKKLQWS